MDTNDHRTFSTKDRYEQEDKEKFTATAGQSQTQFSVSLAAKHAERVCCPTRWKMSNVQRLPSHYIEVEYETDHSPVKRRIYVYHGEDLNEYLSKAWKSTAVRATVHQVSIKQSYNLKPTKTAGVWK